METLEGGNNKEGMRERKKEEKKGARRSSKIEIHLGTET